MILCLKCRSLVVSIPSVIQRQIVCVHGCGDFSIFLISLPLQSSAPAAPQSRTPRHQPSYPLQIPPTGKWSLCVEICPNYCPNPQSEPSESTSVHTRQVLASGCQVSRWETRVFEICHIPPSLEVLSQNAYLLCLYRSRNYKKKSRVLS